MTADKELLESVRRAASQGVGDYMSSQDFEQTVQKFARHTAIEAVQESMVTLARRFGIDIESEGREGRDGMLAPAEVKSMLFWGRGVKRRCTAAGGKALVVGVGLGVTMVFSLLGSGVIYVIKHAITGD